MHKKDIIPAALFALTALAVAGLSCHGDESGPVSVSLTNTPTERAATLTPAATPLAPSPTPRPSLPLSESDAVWREVWADALLVEPVLRPTYLPPSLSRIRPFAGGSRRVSESFGVTYSDLEGETWLSVRASSDHEETSAPTNYVEHVPVRNALGSYILLDAADPTGAARVCWDEPGWAGRAPTRGWLSYCIMAQGLGKEDMVEVAVGLRPLESMMAVPPRSPYRSVEESGVFWQQVAETATSIDPILRPFYVPPAITRVWVPDVDIGGLRVVYSDDSGQVLVTVAAGLLNPALPGPNGVQERVEVRGLAGYYQLQDKAEPLGSAYVAWQQPGTYGEPGIPDGPHADQFLYLISSAGLPKEELLRIADGLGPVVR